MMIGFIPKTDKCILLHAMTLNSELNYWFISSFRHMFSYLYYTYFRVNLTVISFTLQLISS